MNMLRIAWKEIKHDFRDIRTLVFMLALPIVLMLVLGTALTGAFNENENISVDDIKVLYENTNGNLSQSFQDFRKEAEKSDIHIKKLAEQKNGKGLVKAGDADGYVSIDDSGLHLFVNDKNSIKASVLQGTLTTFVDRYNLVMEIAKTDPEQAKTVLSENTQHDYIAEHSLNPAKQPDSMEYYAIVMTTMIALYAAMSASVLISGERIRNTASRLIVAPIRKLDIFTGKVLGSVVLNMLCIVVVVIFSKLAFQANWGDHWGLVFLVLLTEVMLAVGFGVGLSFLIKSPAGPRMVIMVVIQLASFFGGAYFPIEESGGILGTITNLSPLTLENQAMFKMIYANDLSSVMPAIGMNLGIAMLFLLISTVLFRRREGL